jgi:hypothetical protein
MLCGSSGGIFLEHEMATSKIYSPATSLCGELGSC